MTKSLDLIKMPWYGRVQVYSYTGVKMFVGTFNGWEKLTDTVLLILKDSDGRIHRIRNLAVESLETTGNMTEDPRDSMETITMY